VDYWRRQKVTLVWTQDTGYRDTTPEYKWTNNAEVANIAVERIVYSPAIARFKLY
jgi:hypothetical protein